MAQVQICRLTESDYELFSKFLDENWRRGHLFTYNKDIFDFQHRNMDGEYDFLIAKEDNRIVGLFGYIPVSHYDDNLDNRYVWGAIWKVLPESPIGLGLKMLKMIIKQYPQYGAIGLSDDAVKMYKALGYNTGTVNQYYVLNPVMENYSIAIAQTPPLVQFECAETKVEQITSLVGIGEGKIYGVYTPLKSVRYFINRYENHPAYKYNFLLVGNELLLVYRVINVGDSKCLRIIDVLGDLNSVQSLYGCWIELLKKYNAEYIDCLNSGIEQEVFTRHGFKKLDHQSNDVVIPNYFEPFEQRNILLHCGSNSKDANYTFFKGDADQDRPNELNR